MDTKARKTPNENHLPGSPTSALLNRKERKFVAAYIGRSNGNGAEAAKLAGYEQGGACSHANIAVYLLKNINVQATIKECMQAVGLTPEFVRGGVFDIALNSSMDNFMDVDENGREFYDWKKIKDSGLLRFVKEIKHDGKTGAITSLKLHDRVAAYEMLAKFMGMMNEHHEHSGKLKIEVVYVDGDDQAPASPRWASQSN